MGGKNSYTDENLILNIYSTFNPDPSSPSQRVSRSQSVLGLRRRQGGRHHVGESLNSQHYIQGMYPMLEAMIDPGKFYTFYDEILGIWYSTAMILSTEDLTSATAHRKCYYWLFQGGIFLLAAGTVGVGRSVCF